MTASGALRSLSSTVRRSRAPRSTTGTGGGADSEKPSRDISDWAQELQVRGGEETRRSGEEEESRREKTKEENKERRGDERRRENEERTGQGEKGLKKQRKTKGQTLHRGEMDSKKEKHTSINSTWEETTERTRD